MSPVCVLRTEVIVECLEDVWRVSYSNSGGCLIDPGYCQDCSDGITIVKTHFVSSYSTTAFPTDALHNANINRFDGVWKGPGRCQEGVLVTLDTAWRAIMPN